MNQKCISIFLPYYNDATFLADCIQSVLDQTYINFELILFNHASTDGSREIAHQFKDERIMHIDSELNYGAGSGLNLWATLPKTKGDYIKVFCADDIMLPNHLQVLANVLNTKPEANVAISTNCTFINENNQIIHPEHNVLPPRILNSTYPIEWELLKCYFNSFSPLPWGNALVRKGALNNVYRDVSFIYLFDMSFWVNLLVKGNHFSLLNEPIAKYRKSTKSMMGKNISVILQASYFEHLAYCKLFDNILDVSLAKFLSSDVPTTITNKINNEDKQDIPFLLALENAYKTNSAYPHIAPLDIVYMNHFYYTIYFMLQDDKMRNYLKEKFNFTIRDFRKLYLHPTKTPYFTEAPHLHKWQRILKKIFKL